MKIQTLITAVLISVLTAACGMYSVGNVSTEKNTASFPGIDNEIKYLKSTAYIGPSGETGQDALILKSVNDVSGYLALIGGKTIAYSFAVSGIDSWNYTGGPALESALKQYDESFFRTGSLVLILITEGSGSNSHSVDRNLMYAEKGRLHVTVKRTVPEIGTCDMAYWTILIPVQKSFYDGDDVSFSITEELSRFL